MARAHQALLLALLSLFAATACNAPPEGDPDFFAPEDDHSNVAFQGLFDCTETDDVGYSAGTPFDITLVHVDARPLEVATANAYVVMQEAAARAGVALRVVSGFRTMAQQEYFYGCYVRCDCNSCNLAARPGYSNHQSGHALDLNTSDTGVLAWLNAHGASFGFSRTVPSESWHWEWWGGGPGGGPCVEEEVHTACTDGVFAGAFCDDEQSADQAIHDRLVGEGDRELAVDFSCDPVAGQPAFCGDSTITRAEATYVLTEGALIPLSGHPDAFVDDNGHRYEAWLDAARAYDIIFGDGTRVTPDGAASRDTVAVLLARIYALPAPSGDHFSDDDGSANEDLHDRLFEAGLTSGCGIDAGGRARFCGDRVATRSELARFAVAAFDRGLVAVWRQPADNGDTGQRPVFEEPGLVEELPPVTPVDDDPAFVPGDDEALPESDPGDSAHVLTLPPSVVDAGCAQAQTAIAPAWLLGALLFIRKRRRR